MKNYCDYFKNKKITIMGLGILGRGVNVAKFLAECGAELTVTDLKNEADLKPSLKKLAKFKNIRYVLGKHDLADFKDKDMIIKAGGVPLDSLYIKEAEKNGIAIEMDESLFTKLAPEVKVIGITGTRGKSTVTKLIFQILKVSGKERVFLGGNVKGQATLPLLKKIKFGDIVVMELDSWRLQGFHDSKVSPNISVFTSFMADHMNYYKGDIKKYFEDKANIFRYQKEGDLLVLGENFLNQIKKMELFNFFEIFKKEIKTKVIIARKKNIPKNWKIKILGEHNLENIAAAVTVSKYLRINELIIKKVVENFSGEPGRLELIKEIKGIKFYNDTTATTPDAVIAAINSFKSYKGKIILIGGGADKELEFNEYAKFIKKSVKCLILFKGAASDKIKKELFYDDVSNKKSARDFKGVFLNEIKSMKEALKNAVEYAKKGDIVLLSPGAASFGVFKNEFDRGNQFNKEVKKIDLPRNNPL